MGIRVGYRVRRKDGVRGIVQNARPLVAGDEPCFATVEWEDGVRREELLRDVESDPPS